MEAVFNNWKYLQLSCSKKSFVKNKFPFICPNKIHFYLAHLKIKPMLLSQTKFKDDIN